MIGRKKELAVLQRMAGSRRFEFLVMYGRRRVGKTTILQEFAKGQPVIFFPAQEKNDALNLQDFSQSLQEYFADAFLAPFPDWERAFAYFGKQAASRPEKSILIIDEFPFLAAQNASIKSILQHAIDHAWQQQNIMLVLCGSSVRFMVNDVMGYKSPLYGRITGQMEVLPFDYFDSASFFPHYSEEERLLAYGILGGIPRYLNAFDEQESIEQNLAHQVLPESTFLNDEPQMLLRMELREPVVYNSILEAIATGANKVQMIADRIHEPAGKCSKYLSVLQNIRLVRKIVPCGEARTSKKGIYILTDFYYTFWYRYVFSKRSFYALLGEEETAKRIMAGIADYMGPVFEQVCCSYLLRMAKLGALPFLPAHIGKWWGTNPVLRQQDDVDVLALDESGTQGLFCECKYQSRPMPMEEYEDLLTAAMAFPRVKKRWYVFFSRSGYTQPVRERAQREGAVLLQIPDLYSLDSAAWRNDEK